MKVDLSDLSPVKKQMLIEVDPDEVTRERESVIRGYAKKVKIPGFRPGKAPLSVVRARFAKELEEDVQERLVARCYRKAADERGLQPLADPVLEEVKAEEGEPLTFKTTFEVMPEFEPKNYKGVEVRKLVEKVDEEEVDKTLEEIRQSRAQMVTEEGREAQTGDVVVADVEGQPEGGEPFGREGTMIEVGATDNLPRFNEQLEGAREGTELEFSVDYPAEYPNPDLAAKPVSFRLKVHEVKRRDIPTVDDEFAKDLGDFDDLAALRARIREDLEARNARAAEQQMRQSVLDKVLLENPIPLPEVLVRTEIRHRLEEMARRLVMQGVDLENAEIDWDKLHKEQEAPAQKNVHARLMLDAVARAEELSVEADETEERIRRDAAAMGEKPDALKAKLKKHSGMEALKNQMLREKSLDLLTSVANIRSEE